jgi:transcriptional regulator with XRE-family HTH domain
MKETPPSAQIEPWCFQVSVHSGESFGHFLARFRRANRITSKGLAHVLGLAASSVVRWEIPSMGQPPTEDHLQLISQLTNVAVDELRTMLPAKRPDLLLRTRLCAACYAEVPAHLSVWQLVRTGTCERHELELLSACPVCRTGFPLPSRWESGVCEECLLPFSAMGLHQTTVNPNRRPGQGTATSLPK